MRPFVGMLALALALAGCAGGRSSSGPAAVPTGPGAMPLSVPGYEGAIDPIGSPINLAYAGARFSSTVTIGVEGGRGATARTNSLAVYLTGRLTPEDAWIRAELTTERVEVDSQPAQNTAALLVQDMQLDRKGRLIEIAARWPAHTEPGEPLPERYRALEERWRDRLPVFVPAAVSAGDAVYEETGLLAPLRQMLQNRPFQLRAIKPIRAIAVGLTSCEGNRCLIARHEGEAELVAERGTLKVTTAGFTLIDITNGIIRREVGTVTLDGPGGNSRLVMTMRTDTRLF